jgi:hypothetical protein
VDTTTGSLTQLTPSTGFSQKPSINAAGTRISFTSDADLTGEQPGRQLGDLPGHLFRDCERPGHLHSAPLHVHDHSGSRGLSRRVCGDI